MSKLIVIKIKKFLVWPIYYLIHFNFFFGLIHKYIFKTFKYKNFKFKVDYNRIPTSLGSAFLFNTYEYNDRIIIEKHLTVQNQAIVIGGGIGYIPCLTYHLTKKKILVSEIDCSMIPTLKENLKFNKCEFKIIEGNLTTEKKRDYEEFFISKNFTENSCYKNSGEKKVKIKNIDFSSIENIKLFNTLIIDGEGIEEQYIQNIHKLKYVKYLFFEFHNIYFTDLKQKKLFDVLKRNKFLMIDNCFNSFYFKR